MWPPVVEGQPEEFADKYGIELQSIYAFRWRNKHRIAVVLAEYSNEFSDLWSVKKQAGSSPCLVPGFAHIKFRSMKIQCGLYSPGISPSGYGPMSLNPLARYKLWAAVMKSGLSRRTRL